MAPIRLQARNARQFGAVKRPVGHHHEARLQRVAAIGLDNPAGRGLVPGHPGHLGLEERAPVEVEVLADGPAVGQDLRRARILLHRHVAQLFQQRQVDVAFDVAGRAGIAVPVPGAAEVAALLDDPDVRNPGLAQPRGGQLPAETAAHHHDLDLVGQRLAAEARLHIGIVEVAGELTGDLAVLGVAVAAQALVAFLAVLGAQRLWVETEVARGRRSGSRGRERVGHGVRSLGFPSSSWR